MSKESSQAEWSGFCRQERVSWWKREGNPTPVSVHITSFIEGKTEFRVPEKAMVYGLELTQDVHVNGRTIGKAGSIKLLTRAPSNSLEKGIHSRWPVVLDKETKQVYTFGEKDIVRGQCNLQL